MAFVLSALSSLLGFASGGVELGGVQAAGQLQQEQAASQLKQNIQLNSQLYQSVNEASGAGIVANAAAGKYAITQNTQANLYDTQLKFANRWMQVLGGNS